MLRSGLCYKVSVGLRASALPTIAVLKGIQQHVLRHVKNEFTTLTERLNAFAFLFFFLISTEKPPHVGDDIDDCRGHSHNVPHCSCS